MEFTQEELVRRLKNEKISDLFGVQYQPIIDVASNQVYSAEALIRFRDLMIRHITPDLFMPLAEKTDYILEIDRYVFSEACRVLNSSDYMKDVHINIFPSECRTMETLDRFCRIADDVGIGRDRVIVELLESQEIDRFLASHINELHRAGFKIAIDDFGTRMANILTLQNIDYDIVKLDKSLLWTAAEDERARNVYHHTVRMLQKSGADVIQEGVETPEHLQLVQENSIRYVQGFYYSRPLEEKDLMLFVEYFQNGGAVYGKQ